MKASQYVVQVKAINLLPKDALYKWLVHTTQQRNCRPPTIMAYSFLLPPSVNGLQDSIQYHFTNTRHLLGALRTAGSGCATSNTPTGFEGNKRLATTGRCVCQDHRHGNLVPSW